MPPRKMKKGAEEILPEKNPPLRYWEKIPKLNFFVMDQKKFTRLIFGLALISIFLAFYFFWQWDQLKKTPASVAQQELTKTIKKVSKLVELPTDETPTLATVSNPDLLKDQPFLSKAKKGDQILIYAKNKRAIIYDPFQNKIIDIATIDLGTAQ